MNGIKIKPLFFIAMIAFVFAFLIGLVINTIRVHVLTTEEKLLIFCAPYAETSNENDRSQKLPYNKNNENSCSHQQSVGSLNENRKRKTKPGMMHC